MSSSPPFEKHAARLLEASGFVVACAFEWEAPRLSVTRTQPAVLLLDATSTAAHVHRVGEEAQARGIPIVLAHREHELAAAVAAARSRAQNVAGVALPLSADALGAALAALLEAAGDRGGHPTESLGRSAIGRDPRVVRRRDSLAATLHEIEGGELQGVAVIVVSRGWWDELRLSEQTAFHLRCGRQGVALRADDRLSRHFVELGTHPVAPSLSSEREV